MKINRGNGGVLKGSKRERKGGIMAGIDPRHRLHCLSLLPSGPDEVRNRLLRGGRPEPPYIILFSAIQPD